MKRTKNIILLLLMITAMILGVITGCEKKSDNTQSETIKLNIAVQPVVGFLPIYVMRDTGSLEQAYKDNGYNVEINYVEFESGPPENEAFASNQVDVGVMGNVPTISGLANGQARTIIGIAYNGEKTEAILVRKDSDIASPQDLKGKKIGLVVGSIAQNYLSVLLESNGLSLTDVELINLSTGEQQQALETGIVDAVATWEPTISKLVANGDNVVLADGTGIFLGENPIIARTEYVQNNSEIVKIFLTEYKKAAEQIKSDVPKYSQQYAEMFLLDSSIVEAALNNANLPIDITKEDATDLQNTVEFLYGEGLISSELTIEDSILYKID